MGYDQHQQSNSSAAVVLVVVFAVLGVFTVASVGLLLVWNSQSRAVAANELQVAVADVQRAERLAHLQQQFESSVPATADLGLNFDVSLDRKGNIRIDGQQIGLDELRAQLAKLKGETSKAFSVHIKVDSECPVKLVIPVLDVCHEVGDIDFRIVSFADPDASSGDVTAEN